MLIVVAVFLVYHFTVHKITNRRPLGGPNVNVTQGVNATENEASFAIDRARPQLLFGATNQLLTYTTGNGGRTWRSGASPVVREPACARGEPHTAIDGRREVMAFLVSPTCSDQLRSYLAVTSREVGTSRWGPAVRVAPATYRYGFDDAASLAFDARSGRLYLSWTRGLAAKLEARSLRRVPTRGQTWSTPGRRARSRRTSRTCRRSRSRRTATSTSAASMRRTASGSRARPTEDAASGQLVRLHRSARTRPTTARDSRLSRRFRTRRPPVSARARRSRDEEPGRARLRRCRRERHPDVMSQRSIPRSARSSGRR